MSEFAMTEIICRKFMAEANADWKVRSSKRKSTDGYMFLQQALLCHVVQSKKTFLLCLTRKPNILVCSKVSKKRFGGRVFLIG